jgi:primosomal protein N' (replication factor Y) (superfamily II helicase)
VALIKPLKLRAEKVAVRKIKASVNPVARIIVDTKIFHLDEAYSYLVGEDISSTLEVGSIVKVPFGNTVAEGIVIERNEIDSVAGLKFVEAQISAFPALTSAQISFFSEAANRYGCSLWDIFRLALPPFSKTGEKRVNIQKSGHSAQLSPLSPLSQLSPLKSVRREAITLKQGASLIEQVTSLASSYPSAKTLVVVPDEKTMEKLQGIASFLLKSQSGKSERYANYLEANAMQKGIVVGLRSSIFLHLNPGDLLIVIDDADSNFYERHTPTYNVRDMALLRAQVHNVVFLSSCHSLEIERLIDVEYLSTREIGTHSRTVFSDSTSSSHAVISEGLKRGNVLIVHANAGYVNSFLCQHCRNLATCSCGEKLLLGRDGISTTCPLCGTKAASWSCTYCQKSLPRSLSKGVIKRAEDYGRSFPNVRVLSVSAHSPLAQLPAERTLVISTPGMEPDGVYAAICLMDGEQVFGRTGLRSDEQGQLLWSNALCKLANNGEVFISLPKEHPIVQGITRNSWRRTHLSEIQARGSAHLPPEFRLVSIEAELSEINVLPDFFEEMVNEGDIRTIGPMDRAPGISRFIVKYPVVLGNAVVRKVYEINRVRSLQGRKVFRVSVDPYEFI